MKLYNTMSMQKEEFVPIEPGKVRMYACGPTVYNYIHVGNARPIIMFDVLRRYLEYRGYEVTFVQNFTDVDDKIIKRANEEGISSEEVAKKYIAEYFTDAHALGVREATVHPKATENIQQIIDLITTLIDKGYAYEVNGDVYYRTLKFKDYGKLSHQPIEDLQSGARIDVNDIKENPLDFALWKAAKPGEPSWDSPWGKGRPGWHIECSAMSRKYLGLPFDIHGGGADLVFPHHENERAQSEAACGCTFANHWMHGGMLQINHEKMSKSLGNFLLLRDILKTTSPNVLRFLMLQTHYRSPLDFSKERLDEAESALSRIENCVRNMDWQMQNAQDIPSPLDVQAVMKNSKRARVDFVLAMDDDFNAPRALGVVFDLVSYVNSEIADKTLSLSDVPAVRDIRETITTLMRVFGVEVAPQDYEEAETYPAEVVDLAKQVAGYEGADAHEAVDALLEARATARKEKNWAVADAVRDGLTGLGFTIEDTPQGARVSFEA